MAEYHRHSLRLKGYDYSEEGAYFVTICTHRRECLFGEVVGGEMVLNSYGTIAVDGWHNLPEHYSSVELDYFVVMPNHVHGIVTICGVGAGFKPAPTEHGLSEIIRGFKTFSARRINECRRTPGVPVWQRGYYDHIIRNEKSLQGIRSYIANNPAHWNADENHPLYVSGK